MEGSIGLKISAVSFKAMRLTPQRVETVVAFAKSVRIGAHTRDEASSVLQLFRSEWLDFVRVQSTEILITHADFLA